MIPNTRPKPTKLAWGLLLALTGAWLSIGCNPATVYMVLAPFTDTNLPAKHKIATDKEVTVAVVSKFASLETRPELLDAHNELAEKFVAQLAKRTKENKEKVKFVPLAQVRAQQNKLGLNSSYSAADIGKQLKADFVVSLEIGSISLFEKKSFSQFYRGTSEISVQLFDMRKEEGERKVFDDNYAREYPRNPIDAGGSSPAAFRNLYLNRLASDLAKMFTSYPPEERHDE